MKPLMGVLAIAGQAIKTNAEKEQSKMRGIIESIWRYPVQTIALFLFAPIILIRILIKSFKSHHKKASKLKIAITIFGFLTATFLALAGGTFLGSFLGFLFLSSKIGFISAFLFLIGTSTSVLFTVAFQIFIFNSFALLFVKMSQDEVIEHLDSLTEIK